MQLNNAPATAGADAPLEAACRFSRYARRLLEAAPQLASEADCLHPFDEAEMRAALAGLPAEDEAAMRRALRRLRQRVMLRLIARDLSGLADLNEVMATSTALAQVSLSAALSVIGAALARDHGQPRGEESGKVQQLHVVGMGKLGGCELNVSSDIDLVFAYPEEGETDGARVLSNHEYFTRLARRLISALNEVTEDGYVFRIDMRLRPYGDGGPLVSSFEMLENYFVTQGREWERYAWIKGRVLTGDRGQELMEIVRPFVFRRHLDYSAFASLRELHRQIRREVERRDLRDNIKLGHGGIREIEFIAQVFQLIRGGHDPQLRRQATLSVLPLLAERNLLPAEAVEELTRAYVFLRNLEHRLQYLDDQQTHMLPADGADRLAIARSMGYGDEAVLLTALDHHRRCVARHFEAIFSGTSPEPHAHTALWQGAGDIESCVSRLAALGFRRPEELQRRLSAMRSGPRYRAMAATGQSRLDRLVPHVIEAATLCADPDATLARLLELLDSISRRESYLALLEEYPQALTRLAEMMSASQWVAQYLTQHPILLDELLDARTLYAAPDWPALVRSLRALLDEASGDAERQLDILRHFKHAQTLRLIAQDLAGTLPLETLSDHLSDLAGVVLEEVLRLAWSGVRTRHRDEPRFAIIGYGKLGGKELGYASDLDLVFLYNDDAEEAPENYARLAQRINHWLTSMTPAGVLYDIDLRLRPDGAGGLLVSPLASFREYQEKHAWTWEHQALTRARFVAGDRSIGREFEALRVAVLRQPRDPAKLKREIVQMRRKIFDAHPNPTALFDLKHDRGGIIDVEFIVQYLVLAFAHVHAELTGNIGNLALLKLAGRLGLVPQEQALAVHEAYREFRRRQHMLRLAGEKYARVAPAEVARHSRAVRDLWLTVFGEK